MGIDGGDSSRPDHGDRGVALPEGRVDGVVEPITRGDRDHVLEDVVVTEPGCQRVSETARAWPGVIAPVAEKHAHVALPSTTTNRRNRTPTLGRARSVLAIRVLLPTLVARPSGLSGLTK